MPKYVYKCTACDKMLEIIHSMSEKKTFCEICETNTLEKVLTGVTIQYKNSEQAGKIVKETIEEAKEELLREKEELKKQDYKK